MSGSNVNYIEISILMNAQDKLSLNILCTVKSTVCVSIQFNSDSICSTDINLLSEWCQVELYYGICSLNKKPQCPVYKAFPWNRYNVCYSFIGSGKAACTFQNKSVIHSLKAAIILSLSEYINYRLVCRAAAIFNHANLESFQVYNTAGELKCIERKEHPMMASRSKRMEGLPTSLDDPEKDKL